MQTESLKKTTATNTVAAQDRALHDDLLQELTQHKVELEDFARDDGQSMRDSEHVAPVEPDTLRYRVEQTLRNYFAHLDGQPVNNIYEMVLAEVEAPMLEVVMRYTQSNQCKAAELLGLSRGTLRKKLQQHGLL